MRWAALVGLALSTQYLVQPFVWRQWPIEEVLQAWLEIARDRVIVAGWIAIAIVAASRVGSAPVALRAAVMAAAIVVGALLGEVTLALIGSPFAPRGEAAAVRVLQSSVLALCACGIWGLWRRADDLEAAARQAMLAEAGAEAALAEARLLALRQQIEPHFLFNTLATIAQFQEAGSSEAVRLLSHLEKYLGAAVPTRNMTTTLGDEMELVGSYLAIVGVRMSGRLTWSMDVAAAARECACPTLAVATLVENAVKHGIMAAPQGGTIAVTARRTHEGIEVVVADTGAGMLAGNGPVGGSGLGLSNTRARLHALYGPRARLDLHANAPSGVRAVMRWPTAGP